MFFIEPYAVLPNNQQSQQLIALNQIDTFQEKQPKPLNIFQDRAQIWISGPNDSYYTPPFYF